MNYLKLSEIKGLVRIASVQNAYNLINRTAETALAEIFMREEVGLLAFSPLGQGYLTGKYLDGARPAGARTTLFNRGQRYERPGADIAIKAYVNLAKEFGLDPAQMALAFVNTRPFVAANIIGATTMAQLRTNIASIDVAMTPELEARINAVHQLHMNPAP
jgi:aryl-alcohol dehydrogenase-like predicted oxidoreductase